MVAQGSHSGCGFFSGSGPQSRTGATQALAGRAWGACPGWVGLTVQVHRHQLRDVTKTVPYQPLLPNTVPMVPIQFIGKHKTRRKKTDNTQSTVQASYRETVTQRGSHEPRDLSSTTSKGHLGSWILIQTNQQVATVLEMSKETES